MTKTLTDFPELLKEWHSTKNDGINPEIVKFKSSKKFWWKCEREHEWFAAVADRTRGRNCPYCSNKKVCLSNCLATTYPEIAKEWHSSKNNITPYEIVAGSFKKIWWWCDKGHEWQTTVSNRVKLKNKCPFCCGQKVCDSNCLANLRTDIAEEWHPYKNELKPNDFTVNSGKKVWWLGKCGHEWEARIADRTNNSNCPTCNSSKGESKIIDFLEIKELKFYKQVRFKDCKFIINLPFDFLVELYEINFIIEYQGEHHYKPVKWRGANLTNEQAFENFNMIKLRDGIKNQWCEVNKIPLLKIPYWDYDNIEIIIDNFINGLKGHRSAI